MASFRMAFHRCVIAALLLVTEAQQVADECAGIVCPVGTACSVAGGMPVCSDTAGTQVGGGLRGRTGDTTTTPDPVLDLQNCELATCNLRTGSCGDGAPPEQMRCVMWPPYAPYNMRKPKCKFCHRIADFDGSENKVECFYDAPQCTSTSGSGGVGEDGGEEENGFIEKLPGGSAAFIVFVVVCVLGTPCCMFPCVYWFCMQKSEEDDPVPAGMWQPTIRDDPPPPQSSPRHSAHGHPMASPRDFGCESNHCHHMTEHIWDGSTADHEAPLWHRVQNHNSGGLATSRLPHRGSPTVSPRAQETLAHVPSHTIRYNADGSERKSPRLSKLVLAPPGEGEGHEASGSAQHARREGPGSPRHASTGSPRHSHRGSPRREGRGSPRHASTGSPRHSHRGSPRREGPDSPRHANTGSPRHSHPSRLRGSPRREESGSPRHASTGSPRHSHRGSPRREGAGSPRHASTGSPRHSHRGSPRSAHGGNSPKDRESNVHNSESHTKDHKGHHNHHEGHQKHQEQHDGSDLPKGGGHSAKEHLRIRRPDDVAAVEKNVLARQHGSMDEPSEIAKEEEKLKQQLQFPSDVPEKIPSHHLHA